MSRSLNLVSGLYLKISILTIVAGLVLRIVLLFNGQTSDLGFSPGEWCQVFLLGAMNDLCAATIGFGFLWLFMMSVSETKYRKPWSYIILGILAAAFCYVTFCNTIFDEYGSVAPQVASGILGFWAGTFALRLFFRGFRSYWTTVWFALIITLYVGAIVFNAISEYFFWNEFGVRYNFIAVDYLVYTNEVVGNIMESYPVLPMSLGIIVVTLLITWYLFRRDLGQADRLIGWRWKAVAGPAYIAAMLLAVWLLHFNTRFQDSDNVYVNELQANGLYKFYDAFVKNELDYGTVLHHRARSQGRGVRTRCVRQHGRQPACRPQRGARDTAQHRTDNDREHERLVHGSFRQHQAADARARLALRPEPGVRPRLCHG